jgi:hypothetical protein
VVQRGAEQKARQKHRHAVAGLFLLNVVPEGLLGVFLGGGVADVVVVCCAGFFGGSLWEMLGCMCTRES